MQACVTEYPTIEAVAAMAATQATLPAGCGMALQLDEDDETEAAAAAPAAAHAPPQAWALLAPEANSAAVAVVANRDLRTELESTFIGIP